MTGGGVRGGLARRRQSDLGSATVWVLATGMVLVLIAVTLAMAGAATVSRHRAQAAADLAALAGAMRAWEGEPVACQRAADISARNGARLVECRLDGLDLVVAVEVAPAQHIVVGVARGVARAGPAEAASTEGIVEQVGQDVLLVPQWRPDSFRRTPRCATTRWHL